MTFGAPPAAFAASARRVAWLSAPFTLWGLAALLALVLFWANPPLATLAGVVVGIAGGVALHLAGRPRVAGAFVALALAFPVAGQALAHPADAWLLPWAAVPLVVVAPLLA